MKFIPTLVGILQVIVCTLPTASASQNQVTEQEVRTFEKQLSYLSPARKAAAIVRWWDSHEVEFHPAPNVLAIRFFEEIRGCKDAAISTLKSALTNSNPEVRIGASAVLASLYETALPALDKLKQGIEDPDARVRQYSTLAVCNFGCLARPSIPAMIRNLQHESSMLRGWTVFALGYLDEVAKPAVPALVEMLLRPETFQSGWTPKLAVDSLSRILGQPFKDEKEVFDWWEKTGKNLQ